MSYMNFIMIGLLLRVAMDRLCVRLNLSCFTLFLARLPVQCNLQVCLCACVSVCTACAMKALNVKGIVHRDLKPGNILLSHSGKPNPSPTEITLKIGKHRVIRQSALTHYHHIQIKIDT